MSNKKYIYNPEQANFFISEGVKCIEVGINHKTKRAFWVFDYYECQPAYKKWNTREH